MAPQESRFLGRKVKDSDDVLWSVVAWRIFASSLEEQEGKDVV